MTGIDRRKALAFVGAGLGAWGLPLPAQETDRRRPEGGIGGTGIVGLLTDFGSIIVNGLRVGTDAGAVVTDAFGQISFDDLAVGHALTVEAVTFEDGRLEAARIHLTQPLVGRVGFVSPDGMSGSVGGVAVRLEPGSIGTLQSGDRVAVSGLWQGRTVVASRIDPAREALDVLAGQVESVAGDRAVIGGRTVALGLMSPPAAGSFVTVLGVDDGPVLSAQTVVPGRFFGTAGGLIRLSVEGYLNPRAGAPFFEVAGLGHSFDREAQLRPFAEARTLFSGAYTGAFSVETGLILPEGLQERQAVGQSLLGDMPPDLITAR